MALACFQLTRCCRCWFEFSDHQRQQRASYCMQQRQSNYNESLKYTPLAVLHMPPLHHFLTTLKNYFRSPKSSFSIKSMKPYEISTARLKKYSSTDCTGNVHKLNMHKSNLYGTDQISAKRIKIKFGSIQPVLSSMR